MTTPDPHDAAQADAARLRADGERRLHPWSWLFVLIGQLKQFLLPLVALVFFGRGDRYGLYPLIGVGVLALFSAWQYFTYRYRIDGDSLFVRSGLFERSLRQVPFSRIHNVALHQSLLHRVFGVAEVKLESAGGTRPEAEMRVLKLADALALERLIRHRGQSADAVAGTPADETGDTLLSLPTSEVVRLGLISNRGMIVVGGAFALAWQVFPDEAMSGVFKRLWREAFGYVGHYNGGWIGGVLVLAGFVLLALLLVRAFSVALALVRYHGFRLDEHGRRLTVERGLLTRVRTSVPRRRIQAWTLRETALHRLFRRRALEIDTATSQQNPNQEKTLHELAPIATPEACDALVRHVLPGADWPSRDWQALHPRAWQRLLIGDIVFCAAMLAAATWFFGAWGLLSLLWLPWSWLVARRHAARAGYLLDGELVAVREGWWSRHWRFAEIGKLQALELRQSPLDKRFGMASLWLDTAGAGAMAPALRIRYLPEAEARALHARIARDVATRKLAW